MKSRPRRIDMTDMIDMRHELAKLAALIDREVFEREWAGVSVVCRRCGVWLRS